MATRKQISSVNNIAGGSNSSTELTDAGKYSYTALCALGLNYLFDNEWDTSFNSQCLAILMTQLQLPKQVTEEQPIDLHEGPELQFEAGTSYSLVKPFMASILKGEIKQPVEPYIEVLKEEPRLSDDLSIILHDLILLAIHEGKYDARWRVLVQHMAHQLNISIDVIDTFENSVVDCLSRIHPEKTEEEKEGAKTRQKIVKAKRYALIGLATLGGGALIGITGGLAAPFIASGLTTIIGGSAAILGTAAGVAVVGSMFGAAGAGLAGYKMHKRVGEIEEFAFGHLDSVEEIKNNGESESNIVVNTTKQYLHITIAVTGWLKDEDVDNYTRPWLCMCTSKEQYYLRYESSYLLELGRAMDYIVSCMVSMATQEVLKYTALAGILSAIAWPTGLLGLASVIDNPWGVCCRRSAQVGKQLAEVLLSREQGYRPVTLIGYSLGARVIYYCLREMSERVGCEGIIQDAVLIGAPCSGNSFEWKKFTRVVAGRIVNAYCKTDWLLKFLYRTLSMPTGGVAGLQPITLDDRRMENVDLSHIVSGHSEYPDKMYEILQEIGIKVIQLKIDSGDKKISRVQTVDVINVTSKPKEEDCIRKCLSENALSTLDKEKPSQDKL